MRQGCYAALAPASALTAVTRHPVARDNRAGREANATRRSRCVSWRPAARTTRILQLWLSHVPENGLRPFGQLALVLAPGGAAYDRFCVDPPSTQRITVPSRDAGIVTRRLQRCRNSASSIVLGAASPRGGLSDIGGQQRLRRPRATSSTVTHDLCRCEFIRTRRCMVASRPNEFGPTKQVVARVEGASPLPGA